MRDLTDRCRQDFGRSLQRGEELPPKRQRPIIYGGRIGHIRLVGTDRIVDTMHAAAVSFGFSDIGCIRICPRSSIGWKRERVLFGPSYIQAIGHACIVNPNRSR